MTQSTLKLNIEIDFLIKNSSKSIYTSRKDLRKRFNRFKDYYHKLEPTTTKLYNDLILTKTKPTDIKPMTIGAFFFGSSLNNYGALTKKESILCYESVGKKLKNIHTQLWLYIDGKYKKINQSTSEIGYIFVDDVFTHFTPENIRLIKNSHIKRGCIYKTNYSKHYAYHEGKFSVEAAQNINIKQFPVKRERDTPKEETLIKIKEHVANNTWLIFLILLIFFLLVIYIYKYQKTKKI